MKFDRHLSYSAITKYQQCPYAWYLRYILNNPDSFEDRSYLDFGSCIHKILEKFHEKLPNYTSENGTFKEPDGQITEALNETIQKYWDHNINQQMREEALKFLNDFVKWELERYHHYKSIGKIKDFFPVRLEQMYRTDEHKLMAKVDRVNMNAKGEFVVIDYKTSRTKNKKKVPEDALLQAGINAICLEANDIKIDKFYFMYLNFFPNPFLVVDINQELIEKTFNIVRNIRSEIEEENFSKNEDKCFGCSQKVNCIVEDVGIGCFDEVIGVR